MDRWAGLEGIEVSLPGRGVIWARVGGRGSRPLLLLHGWTATADLNWGACYPALADDHVVIAPDHRGHGRGLRSAEPFTLEAAADDAAALLHELDCGPARIVGYSMGGPVAQLLWHRHPELVDGLVFAATAATFNDSSPERAMFWALNGLTGVAPVVPRPLRGRMALRILSNRRDEDDDVERDPGTIADHDWLQVARAGRAIGRFDSRAWIGDLDRPTAVIATMRDHVVPPRRQIDLHRRMPGSSLHPVDGDHATVLRERGPFVPALLDALDALDQPDDGGSIADTA